MALCAAAYKGFEVVYDRPIFLYLAYILTFGILELFLLLQPMNIS